MAGKYVLKSTTNGGYHFTLKAANGESILSSETYTSKSGATNGIDSVKTNSPNDARYEKKQAANGQYMFNLKAANGERIGSSETYTTESARDNGIASVKANGPTASTDDQT
jgi:uncharacterized protein YegP (UPF0339 family)